MRLYKFIRVPYSQPLSAGQFWQHNRGNMAIRRQPLVRSARRGCRTKGLDPARRAMSYLLLIEFSLPLNDHSPPRRTSERLTSFVEAVLPPHVEMPRIYEWE